MKFALEPSSAVPIPTTNGWPPYCRLAHQSGNRGYLQEGTVDLFEDGSHFLHVYVLAPDVFILVITNQKRPGGKINDRCPSEGGCIRGKGNCHMTFTSPSNHFVPTVQEPPEQNLLSQNWGYLYLATIRRPRYGRCHLPDIKFSPGKSQ